MAEYKCNKQTNNTWKDLSTFRPCSPLLEVIFDHPCPIKAKDTEIATSFAGRLGNWVRQGHKVTAGVSLRPPLKPLSAIWSGTKRLTGSPATGWILAQDQRPSPTDLDTPTQERRVGPER